MKSRYPPQLSWDWLNYTSTGIFSEIFDRKILAASMNSMDLWLATKDEGRKSLLLQ